MTTATATPDSYSFRFGGSGPPSGTVGTWPVLADVDDATYVEIANGDEAEFLFTTPVGSGVGTIDDVTVHLRMKLSGDDATVREARVQVNLFDTAGDVFGTWVGSLPDPSLWYDVDLPLGPYVSPTNGSIVYLADGAGHTDGDPASLHWWTFINHTDPDWSGHPSSNDDPWPLLLAALAGGTLQADIIDSDGTRNVKLSQFTLTVPAAVALPCDTPVDVPLDAFAFLTDAPGALPGPYGQYSDGVIWPVTDALGGGVDGFPDFYLPGVTTEAKPYRITITFDPTSPHDEGTRQFWITSVPAGSEQAAYSGGGLTLGSLHNGSANTADSVTVTIHPAAGQNFWFETDHGGAVSGVTILKDCGTGPRPPTIGGGPGVGSAPAPGSGSGDPTAPVAGDTAPTAPALGGGFLTPGRRRGAPTDVEVLVDGHWLSLNCQVSDPTWSHTWPGGSANASWTATDTPTRLTRRGLPVQLAYGGQRFWAGVLDLPGGDGTMNAVGLATLGGNYTALDADGDATTVPDDAIDAAITRGLPWLRRDSFSADAQDIDISSGPVTLGALLDAAATDARKRWAVDPDGNVYAAPDPTVPTGHILYLDAPLTPADDQLATALVGRYFNGTDYATTTVVADSAAWLGYLEATVDLTGRGTLTEEKAIDKLQALLDLGRALPAWADPIALVYGDLVTAGQVPVELETFVAGQVVRVGGQFDATQQLGGRTWVDVLVGQSDGGGGSLSLTPIGAPVFGLFDAITQLQNRKGA